MAPAFCGATGAMITAVTLLRRRPGLSPGEFRDYWRTRHAAVIGTLPGVLRYTQSHPLDNEPGNDTAGWDGVAELWAADSQAFRRIGGSDAYRAVLKDEENFLDRDATALVLTEASVRRDAPLPADGVKLIRFFRRRPGLEPAEFQAYWRDAYGPLADALPDLARYVQYHARLGGYRDGREPAYDGFDVSWFADAGRLRAALRSAEAKRASGAEAAFLAPGPPAALRTRELALIG